ncbi:hypothetical protein [Halegenticoccus soli]|uniref:hypothetical protein n=1 Tax=Halegenticoccus soli TaxID=1985678 RepID=UPI00117BADD6|nr:hypothetical protein [Halegenticoccus soli]
MRQTERAKPAIGPARRENRGVRNILCGGVCGVCGVRDIFCGGVRDVVRIAVSEGDLPESMCRRR